jgi:sugar-specific transcriptional regulator TrmB
MSLKCTLQTLKALGLNEREAKIYIFLAKKGPHKKDELAFALNISKPQLNLNLENLKDKHMICTVPENSITYVANTFEKILNEFMKQTKQQAKALQDRKAELLSAWQSIIKDSTNS